MTDLLTGDDAIRAVVTRLARPHPQGNVIERAAILAEGESSAAVLAWITAHHGTPEVVAPSAPGRGLHAGRDVVARPPSRYVLPAGALG